jgi:aspartate 1-decarboxylase
MMIQILKSKIQGVIVTESNIDYPGSISLPAELMKASGIRQFELVHVNNKTNGNRIVTYAIKNNQKGRVTVNGAASKFFKKEDVVHVLAFAFINEAEAETFSPTLVLTDKENNVVESKPYSIG